MKTFRRRIPPRDRCALSPEMAVLAPQLLSAARSIDPSFRITSSCRTRQQQTQLYNEFLRGESRLPVAPPGKSLHELGLAVDLARDIDPYADAALASLGRWWSDAGFGWSHSDPVHFQLPPIRDRPSARAALSVDPGGNGMLRSPTPSEMPAGSLGVRDLQGSYGGPGVAERMSPLVGQAVGFALGGPAGALVAKIAAPLLTPVVSAIAGAPAAIGGALVDVFGADSGPPSTLHITPAQTRATSAGIRTSLAGDPGVRSHLAMLRHVARQLCKVLAAFD